MSTKKVPATTDTFAQTPLVNRPALVRKLLTRHSKRRRLYRNRFCPPAEFSLTPSKPASRNFAISRSPFFAVSIMRVAISSYTIGGWPLIMKFSTSDVESLTEQCGYFVIKNSAAFAYKRNDRRHYVGSA